MGRKTVTLEYDGSDYRLGEGKRNNKYLLTMCPEYFENLVRVIGVPKREYIDNHWDTTLKVLSMNFVGLKKSNESTNGVGFITKDKDKWDEFKVWAENPGFLWDEENKIFNNPSNDEVLLLNMDKRWFERITRIRKRATLQVGDIYSFRRIDVRVKKL